MIPAIDLQGFYSDVAQSRTNGASNETRTHM